MTVQFVTNVHTVVKTTKAAQKTLENVREEEKWNNVCQ